MTRRFALLLSAFLSTAISPPAAGTAFAGGPLTADLRLVTGVPEMDGMQAGNPVWAPGDVPRLVHEMSDRSRRTSLRVVAVQEGPFAGYVVPSATSSRLDALGAGAARSDSDARWTNPWSFWFVRTRGEGGQLYAFDGAPRRVDLAGRVQEAAPDPDGERVYASLSTDDGADVYVLRPSDPTAAGERLSRTPSEVEHSIQVDSAGGRVVWVASSREETAVVDVRPDGTRPRRRRLAGFELLSVAPLPGGDAVVALARVCSQPPACTEDEHALVSMDLGTGASRVLARKVMVPPGAPLPPALSPDGRYLYWVARDEARSNPLQRLDLESQEVVAVATGTRGNQQVAVAAYPGTEGVLLHWIAVVAVGGIEEDDVGNHVWVGPVREGEAGR